ncbi:hypothetical protein P4S93_13355 [Aneurinibacillus thermoaerophilus]|nr:hypothetical protein [Aneurinibacillus thermoaerophilus]MED0761752.1 hypothetical protein [Aneurinibacillus thermoaerophilus]
MDIQSGRSYRIRKNEAAQSIELNNEADALAGQALRGEFIVSRKQL